MVNSVEFFRRYFFFYISLKIAGKLYFATLNISVARNCKSLSQKR